MSPSSRFLKRVKLLTAGSALLEQRVLNSADYRYPDCTAPPAVSKSSQKNTSCNDVKLNVACLKQYFFLFPFRFSIITEENLGNYSCVFGNEAKVDFIVAAPQIAEMRDKPIVSYVGDSVVLVCKMEEAKPKPTTWNWYKENGTEKEQIFTAAEPDRYEIHNDERKTKLKLKNLTEADSGLYYCGAVYAISIPMSHMKLKVITFMEPLKPFLSIMAEVIVLVAAILLCERSQSKKNNTEDATNADQNDTL
ncbi:embigin [Xenentodon cancila]